MPIPIAFWSGDGSPAPGPGPFPSGIPNLMGWWDASDAATVHATSGRVTQWDDKSGNARHMTQATDASRFTTGSRTTNGLNTFEGAGAAWMLVPHILLPTQEMTVFIAGGNKDGTYGSIVFTSSAIYVGTPSQWYLPSLMAGGIVGVDINAVTHNLTGLGGATVDDAVHIFGYHEHLSLVATTFFDELSANSSTTVGFNIDGLANYASALFNWDGPLGEIAVWAHDSTTQQLADIYSYFTRWTTGGGGGGGATNFIFNETVGGSSVINYHLYNRAVAAGWDEVKPLTAVVTVAITETGTSVRGHVLDDRLLNTIGSSDPSLPAFRTGSGFPVGSTLRLNVFGGVYGAPGVGGDGAADDVAGTNGGNGGLAILAEADITIDSIGIIAGGGGGSGGGGERIRVGDTDRAGGGAGGGGRGYGRDDGVGGLGGVPTLASVANNPGGDADNSLPPIVGTGSPGAGAVIPGGGHGGTGYQGGEFGVDGTDGQAAYGGSGTSTAAGTKGLGGAAVSGDSFVTWVRTGTRHGSIT